MGWADRHSCSGAGLFHVIENKINAADQPSQLYRYWDYARQLNEFYVIVLPDPARRSVVAAVIFA